MVAAVRGLASKILLFERFDLVCDVVEVDCDSMLTHKLSALHPDLGKLRLKRRWLLRAAALRHIDLIDAAFLGGLVHLSRYNLV